MSLERRRLCARGWGPSRQRNRAAEAWTGRHVAGSWGQCCSRGARWTRRCGSASGSFSPSSSPDPSYSVSAAELDVEHTQKVLEMEQAQQMKLKERQKFFEEAFQQDMEQYLSTGYLQIAERRGKSGSRCVGGCALERGWGGAPEASLLLEPKLQVDASCRRFGRRLQS